MIFDVVRATIAAWLNRWEQSGFDGFEDEDHRREPRVLDDEERELAAELLGQYPRQPERVLEELRKQTGKTISRRALRRLARVAKLAWERMRRVVNPTAQQPSESPRSQRKTQAKAVLSELRREEAAEKIDLQFFDEVGFSLTPTVP